MKKWYLALALALLLSGCTTPMQRLAVAEQSLISTGRLLITARNAGLLTQAEWARVKEMAKRADQVLDSAHALVVAGEDIGPALKSFNAILDELIKARAIAQARKETDSGY